MHLAVALSVKVRVGGAKNIVSRCSGVAQAILVSASPANCGMASVANWTAGKVIITRCLLPQAAPADSSPLHKLTGIF